MSNPFKTIPFIGFLLIIQLASAQNFIRNFFKQENAHQLDTIITLQDHNGHQATLPISLRKGAKPGPTFTIIAGIHGMEYPPILAASQLLQEIEPSELEGNLIIVPLANTAAFYQRTPFYNPLDHKNLNRAFPGNSNGSITEVLADYITQHIYPISDVVLDMHAGDANEDLLPFICYYNNTDFAAQTQLATQLCDVSGFENIVSYPYHLSADQPAEYAFKQAVQQGIPALSIEMGKLGNVKPVEVSYITNAVYRMLNYMNMYQKPTPKTNRSKNYYTNQAYIPAPMQGLFYSDYKAGDMVTKGTLLGIVKDIFGNELAKVYATTTGTILYKIGTPPLTKGQTLFCIGTGS